MLEQEGDMQAEGLSPMAAGGLGSFILALLAGIGWLWRERQKAPLDYAERGAGIARAQMDEAAANGMRSIAELLRQEINLHAAALADLREQNTRMGQQLSEAQATVLALRQELTSVQSQLKVAKVRAADAELRAANLQARIAVLEQHIRQSGLEIPK